MKFPAAPESRSAVVVMSWFCDLTVTGSLMLVTELIDRGNVTHRAPI